MSQPRCYKLRKKIAYVQTTLSPIGVPGLKIFPDAITALNRLVHTNLSLDSSDTTVVPVDKTNAVIGDKFLESLSKRQCANFFMES